MRHFCAACSCWKLKDEKQQPPTIARRRPNCPCTKHWKSSISPILPTVSDRRLWELAELSFLKTHTNIVFLGPPGVGKTHLALSLAVKALEAGYSVLFTTLASLAEDLAAAPHPSLVSKRLRRYLTPRLLIVDEIGYTKLAEEQANALFELVRSRYEQGSTIFTSNTSFSEWGHLLGNEVLATALLDRLLHHAEVISIPGKSFRMKDRMSPAKGKNSPTKPESEKGGQS